MVSFIGAGPGDPELLTIKGKKIIDSADVIIYAGSLVNPEVLRDAKPDAAIYNSAGMTLEEVLAVMKDGEEKGPIRMLRLPEHWKLPNAPCRNRRIGNWNT